MPINETVYYEKTGDLYPLDIRHTPRERVFFDAGSDGKIRLRVHTEPGFAEVIVIYNDGTSQAEKLALWAETGRFQYWQGEIHPAAQRFHYHIALKRTDGHVAYYGPTGCTSAAEFYFQVDLSQVIRLETPAWLHGAVMYQVFPERFANGEPNLNPPGTDPWGTPPGSFQFQGGDLVGILEKLDYLEDLGIDILYLNPIFTSPSNHKYDCNDYYNVDPAFGGNPALAALVDGLHQRGMKIILDASFNHCHPTFFAFQDVIQHGPASQYWDWFSIYEHPIQVRVRPQRFPPEMQARSKDFENWCQSFAQLTGIKITLAEDDGPALDPTYLAWYGVLTMPKLNLSNPAARQYFLEVTRFWIEAYQIDGWRMDVVPFVAPDFWDDFRQVAKTTNPETALIAEIWGNGSFWLQGERFDGTMNYTFRTLALEYFAKTMLDTRTFIEGCQTMLMLYARDITQVGQNLLSSHDTKRFLNEAGEDLQRLRLASLFQLTMPGVPSIYYGDEIGLSGGSDPDNRRAFPWQAPDSWDAETRTIIRTLIKLRQEFPALRYGDWEIVWMAAEALAYRRFTEQQQVLVVISRQTALEDGVIPLKTNALQLLWGTVNFEKLENGIKIQRLAPWSGAIFLI
ncbi:MAG TPA: alpha-amylase [Chloroflexi bacterium]|nr:alpha-amylase [Chloroflexota bacterium]